MSLRSPQLTKLVLPLLLFGVLANAARGKDDDTERLCKAHFAASKAYEEEYQARLRQKDSVTFLLDAQRSFIRSELAYLECIDKLASDTPVAKYVRQLTRDRRAAFLDTHVRSAHDLVQTLEGPDVKQAIGQYEFLTKLRKEELARYQGR